MISENEPTVGRPLAAETRFVDENVVVPAEFDQVAETRLAAESKNVVFASEYGSAKCRSSPDGSVTNAISQPRG